MIQKMFAVRDAKAQAFLQPFFSSANGSALRALGDAVNDGKSPIALHPEDYILYEIGAFDDQTGEIVGLTPIKLLACASDFSTTQSNFVKAGLPGVALNPESVVTTSNGEK